MRLKNDQYFTPPAIIRPLLKEIQFDKDDLIFEPCAGDRAIVKVLKSDGYTEIIDSDIDPVHEITKISECCFSSGFDATTPNWKERIFMNACSPDWVVTNPPYKQPDCDQIIQNAWDCCDKGIAMLLRLSYLEPCQNRSKFLKEATLTNLIIFNPRPQFIPGKKATDSSTVAWFVWQKESIGQTQITYCTDWNE